MKWLLQLFVCYLALYCSSAFAEKFEVFLINGNKHVQFSVRSDAKKEWLIRREGGKTKEISLTQKNAASFTRRIGKISKMKTWKPSQCERRYILISSPHAKKPIVGCLASKTEVTQDMVKLVNLLETVSKTM